MTPEEKRDAKLSLEAGTPATIEQSLTAIRARAMQAEFDLSRIVRMPQAEAIRLMVADIATCRDLLTACDQPFAPLFGETGAALALHDQRVAARRRSSAREMEERIEENGAGR